MPFIYFGHYRTDYDFKESDGKWFVNNLRITSPDKKEVEAYGSRRSDFDNGFSSQEEAKIAVRDFGRNEIDKDIKKRKDQERSK
jgi:hypothetical protein